MGLRKEFLFFVRWSTFVYIPRRRDLEGAAVKFKDLEDDGAN